MTKVITDEKQIDDLLERGVEKIYPNKEDLKKKLMSGDRIRLYCGFDPSAPSLHIGNAIQINKLAQFQELGHEVIFLIGDFTGMIGDPTDKSATRKKLTREEVLENAKSYKDQANGYLKFDGDNPALVKYNSEWSDKLTFKDLIEVSSNFTVQQMIQRDMFQQRLKDEKPIHLHEFLYPLAQGYDSMAMDVDLEIGGNDQMFNMMAGRDLMKAEGKKEKFVLTMKLLADDSGKKMGKSEGNAVFLDQDPANMYGVVMSWADGVIGVGFELATKVSFEEVKEIYKQLEDPKTNPRDMKMKLAFEIVKANYCEEAAQEAQERFVSTVQKKEIPTDIPEYKLTEKKGLIDVLFDSELVASKSEARRMIKQGGVKLDGEQITDENFELEPEDKERVLQKGKLHFRKIV
ncbi:tyrosine--tRNA ligase [Candidatus Parcubacteria bacterium]|nr:MAG: tyrosine--tRNA ligase [Candidatus Parcubacteria bacterium]